MRNDLRVEWRWCAKIPSTRFLSIILRSCKHLNVNVITNYVRVSVVLYSRDQRELRLRFEHDDFFFSLRFHTLDILSLYGMEILKIPLYTENTILYSIFKLDSTCSWNRFAKIFLTYDRYIRRIFFRVVCISIRNKKKKEKKIRKSRTIRTNINACKYRNEWRNGASRLARSSLILWLQL